MIAAAIHFKTIARRWWPAAVWLFAIGASPAPGLLMKRGDYQGAVAGYRELEARRPRDAAVKRNLGIVLLKSGQAADAVVKLEEARALDRRDRATLYFLGEAAEQSNQPDLAREAYRQYLGVAGHDKRDAVVRARVQALSIAEMQSWVKARIQAEDTLHAGAVPSNTIAIPQFIAPASADTLRPLCRGLAVVMTTDLSLVPGLRVVERERLGVLLEEIERTYPLPLTEAQARGPGFREEEAPRVGVLLAARHFAQGGFEPLERSQIQMDAALIDVSSSAITPAGAPVGGPLVDVLKLEKSLVFQVLHTLGIPVPDPLRARIAHLPTQSFEAFLEFSRGVEYEEQGLQKQAVAAYRKAASLDPSFAMPRAREELLSVTPADAFALDAALYAAAVNESVTGERLLRSGTELAMGPGPFRTRQTATDPTITDAAKAGSVEIKVTGRLP